jgi:hypothetical protein
LISSSLECSESIGSKEFGASSPDIAGRLDAVGADGSLLLP